MINKFFFCYIHKYNYAISKISNYFYSRMCSVYVAEVNGRLMQ